jgi:hypothetical protein
MSERSNGRQPHVVMLALLLLCGWLIYDRQRLREQLAAPLAGNGEVAAAADAVAAKLSPAKAQQLGPFYEALADVVSRDSSIITSTGVFRTGHNRALRLAFAETEVAGEPRVGDLVDRVFFAAMGKDDKAIDAAAKADLLEAINAVIQACEEASK